MPTAGEGERVAAFWDEREADWGDHWLRPGFEVQLAFQLALAIAGDEGITDPAVVLGLTRLLLERQPAPMW